MHKVRRQDKRCTFPLDPKFTLDIAQKVSKIDVYGENVFGRMGDRVLGHVRNSLPDFEKPLTGIQLRSKRLSRTKTSKAISDLWMAKR